MWQFAKRLQTWLQPLPARRRANRTARQRLEFEALEDRVVPTAVLGDSITGVVSGVAFVDSNSNGVREATESVLTGVAVTLSGAGGSTTALTDANGVYTFREVAPGTYQLSVNPGPNFLPGGAVAGSQGGTASGGAVASIVVDQGEVLVNYALTSAGLTPGALSLRQLVTQPAEGAFFFQTPATTGGTVFADHSVQPATAATPGSASLAGSIFNDTINNGVLDTGEAGIAGAQVVLTGIDSSGEAVFRTVTTNASGEYSFTALRAGTYTITVATFPDGFRAGRPTIGLISSNANGIEVQNNIISQISLPDTQTGSNYNFAGLALPAPGAGPLSIAAHLVNDTGRTPGSENDGLTSDASVAGTIAGSGIVSFQGSIDAGGFVDLRGSLMPGGQFLLSSAVMAQIAGGTLGSGMHTLHLQATDSQGHVANLDVLFTFNATTPDLTLQIQGSAPEVVGDATSLALVTLTGTTSAGAFVELTLPNGTVRTTTADAMTGTFTIDNVTLNSGANKFRVLATDDAGNKRQLVKVLVQNRAPTDSATPLANITAASTAANQVLDLARNFTDLDLGNTTGSNLVGTRIRIHTIAGSIDIDLFDGATPQTVANFLSYINANRFDSSFFHRLQRGFVLQGGGFDFDTTDPISFGTIANNDPTVQNEFDATNRPNTTGTIAMAKGSSADSATNQFFFNLANNMTLDSTSNSGGFTVFGKIVDGTDQRVLNTLTSFATPLGTEDLTNVPSNISSAFFNPDGTPALPLRDYTGTNFPADATTDNFAFITDVEVIYQPERLTYTIIANPDSSTLNTSVVTATFDPQHANRLTLDFVAAGTTQLTIQATDKFGASTTKTITITVT